ncbi:MAG: TonB-dependent receptor, partial [Caulobacter sp.]
TCGNFPVKINGFRSNCEMPADLSPYASVDVLKGSSSSVYGQSFVSGTLVLNSKLPKQDFGGSASLEYGQFKHLSGQFDVYGSLTQDQRVYGRLILSGVDEEASFTSFERKHVTVAPSLKFDITDKDTLTWVLSYTHINDGAGFGFPLAFDSSGAGGATNGANYSIPDLSYDQLGFLQPDWARHSGHWMDTSIKYEHVFDNNWHLSIAAQHNEANYENKYVWVGAFSTLSTDKTQSTNVYLYYDTERDHQWAGEVNLFGDVEAFGHKQTFFFGADYTETVLGISPYIGRWLSGSDSGFNVYEGNWSALPDPDGESGFLSGGTYYPASYAVAYHRKEVNSGFEIGAILRPSDKLTFNLGARWSNDTVRQQRVCCSLPLASLEDAATTTPRPDQSQWTYQLGANYALTPGLHGYVSYGTTFEAANRYGYDPDNPTGSGIFLGPQKGKTAELGLKGQSSNKLVNWSIDVFETSISNSFQQDPDHTQYTISTGAQRARGVEAEWQGKLTPNWDVSASVSSTKNTYQAGPLKGISSPFAVPLGISVFSSYKFLDGPLEGLGFGGGYIYKDRAKYVLNNGADISHLIADQKELDLRLFYEKDAWRFDLYANNVTNQRYIAPRLANAVQYDWFVNQPRRIYAKVSAKF